MFILVTAILMALLLLPQAIHLLRRGDARLFFHDRNRQERRRTMPRAERIAGALLYGVSGCLILLVLGSKAVRMGKSAIFGYLTMHGVDLIGPLTTVGVGVWLLIRPEVGIANLRRIYPNLDQEPKARSLANWIQIMAAVLIGFALFSLARP